MDIQGIKRNRQAGHTFSAGQRSYDTDIPMGDHTTPQIAVLTAFIHQLPCNRYNIADPFTMSSVHGSCTPLIFPTNKEAFASAPVEIETIILSLKDSQITRVEANSE